MDTAETTDKPHPVSDALERAGCTERCWTLAKCPTCGSTMPPRGRAAPLYWHIGSCCDDARNDIQINPAHYWNLDDATELAEWLDERREN